MFVFVAVITGVSSLKGLQGPRDFTFNRGQDMYHPPGTAWWGGVCDCLPWNSGFQTNMAGGCDKLGDWLCGQFWEKLPENYCMNDHMDGEFSNSTQQYCIVGAGCKKGFRDMKFMAGAGKPNMLRKKACVEGEDTFLRDYTPSMIENMAKVYDVDVSLLFKMAYPVIDHDNGLKIKASEVTADFATKHPEKAARRQKLLADIPRAVLNSESNMPPFQVLTKCASFAVRFDDADTYKSMYDDLKLKAKEGIKIEHPSKATKMVKLYGNEYC